MNMKKINRIIYQLRSENLAVNSNLLIQKIYSIKPELSGKLIIIGQN